MALYSALYSGLSGLETSSLLMSVIGDNLANLNTIGFKKSRANFQDMLGFPVIGQGTETYVGRGAMVDNIEQVYTQGSFVSTGNGLDLAITGKGFFVVRGSAAGQTGNFYTRDGQFNVDAQGNLTTVSGMIVQGYKANNTGNISSVLGDLNFSSARAQASATGEVELYANLNSEETAIPGGFDITDINGTAHHSATINVYDSLGASHKVTVYFTKTADNTWSWNATADGGELVGGTAGTPEIRASGTMTFDSEGKLASVTETANDFDFIGGPVQNQTITFNFGDPTGTGGTGLAGSTQAAATYNTSFQSQDGYAAGELVSIIVDADGMITGTFSNGEKRTLGQIAIADFKSTGLNRLGGNIFTATNESGEAIVGGANTGGRGAISSKVLESSNVDLGSEFGNMIITQRAFQANSRTITTVDSMMNELINLKR